METLVLMPVYNSRAEGGGGRILKSATRIYCCCYTLPFVFSRYRIIFRSSSAALLALTSKRPLPSLKKICLFVARSYDDDEEISVMVWLTRVSLLVKFDKVATTFLLCDFSRCDWDDFYDELESVKDSEMPQKVNWAISRIVMRSAFYWQSKRERNCGTD